MQFKKEIETTVKVNTKPEEIKENNWEDLREEYSGPLNEIVATLFKIIVKVNIVVPGSFKSASNQSCVKCTLRTHQGFLFPLQKSLIFINKTVYIPLSEIKLVEFHRIGQSALSKLFDIKILTKTGNH